MEVNEDEGYNSTQDGTVSDLKKEQKTRWLKKVNAKAFSQAFDEGFYLGLLFPCGHFLHIVCFSQQSFI